MPPLRIRLYLLTGLITFLPLWLTWVVFKFVLGVLANMGAPLLAALNQTLEPWSPHAARFVTEHGVLADLLALILTLLSIYLLGWLSSRMIGERLLAAFEKLLNRIPLVQTIYGGTKKLMSALQQKPSGMQRVVLVDFPSPGIKAVGFVTGVMKDGGNNDPERVAVFVPTTPNPTSGFLLMLPSRDVIPTDWSMDQAMAFIISGGAAAPERMPPLSP